MGYTLKKIIFVKKHDTHIPYYLGMIVEGPQGGRYYLGENSTEIALDTLTKGKCTQGITDIMTQIGKELNNIEVIANDKMVNSILNKYGAFKLLSSTGKHTAETIGKGLSLSQAGHKDYTI